MNLKNWIRQLYFYSSYTKALSVLILLFMIVMSGMMCLIMPQKKLIQQKKELIMAEQQKYKIMKLQQIKVKNIGSKEKLIRNHFFQKLPMARHFTLNEMMLQLSQLATSCHIKLVSIKPNKSIKCYEWHQLILNLTILSDDPFFLHWLWLLGQQHGLWKIEQCELMKVSNKLSINLQLVVYYV